MPEFDESRLNPLTVHVRAAEESVEKLVAQRAQGEQDLHWYRTTNRDEVGIKLRELTERANSLRIDIEAKKGELADCKAALQEVARSIGTFFNPLNWFATEQRQFRGKRNQLKKAHTSFESGTQQLSVRLKETELEIESTSTIAKRHDSFSLEGHRKAQANLDQQIAIQRKKLERLNERKEGVDRALEPVVKQMRENENRTQSAKTDQSRASDLERKLSNAGNSYEKAMVHQQCEQQFSSGSPRSVIDRLTRDITRLERDYEKLQRRATDIVERASRTIRCIVIDGNNLCYEDKKFIGLAALEAAVPLLDSEHKLVIVFDASIRRMLRTDDAGIKARFPDTVKVHIVATRSKADETVLGLADDDSSTYVLSNDRFGEFNDRRVIKDDRVIRHEIVDGRIFIHDLGIQANQKLEPHEPTFRSGRSN